MSQQQQQKPQAAEPRPDNRPLPLAKRKPVIAAENRTYVLYGIPKVGKSTFAAGMPDPLFFAFEDGCRHLEVFITPEKELEYTWPMWLDDLRKVRTLVKSNKCPYRTLVVDVTELCFEACRKHCLKKYGVDHESDLEWGKGWSIVEWEFSRVLSGVKNLGLGLVLITHMDDKEIADFAGKKHTKHTTALPKKAREIVFGMADVILFAAMGIDPLTGKWRRELHTKPSQDYEAGGRYLNPEGMPRKLPLAWEPFRLAFETGLTEQQLAERFGFYTRALKDKRDTSLGDEEPEAPDATDHADGDEPPAPGTEGGEGGESAESGEVDPFGDGANPARPAADIDPQSDVEPFGDKVEHVPPERRSVKGPNDASAIAHSSTVTSVDTKPDAPASAPPEASDASDPLTENGEAADPVIEYAREVNTLKGDALMSEWEGVAKRVNYTGQKPRKVGEARAQLVDWFKQSSNGVAATA